MSARTWQGAKVAIMAKRMRQFMDPLYGQKMNKRFIGWRFSPVSSGSAWGTLFGKKLACGK
jgi:hypothetical protein